MLNSHLSNSFFKTNPFQTGFFQTGFFQVALAICVIAIFCPNANAQWLEKESDLVGPFVDGEPFDVIYLNDDGNDAIMKVKPIKKVPTTIPTQGTLVFEYFSDDEDKLEGLIQASKRSKRLKNSCSMSQTNGLRKNSTRNHSATCFGFMTMVGKMIHSSLVL